MKIYDSDLGVVKVDGLYIDVDNRFDKEFENHAQLAEWLKKHHAEFAGVEARRQQEGN